MIELDSLNEIQRHFIFLCLNFCQGSCIPRHFSFDEFQPRQVFPPSHFRDRLPDASWEEVNRFAAQAVEDAIVAEDPLAGISAEVNALMTQPSHQYGNGGTAARTDPDFLR